MGQKGFSAVGSLFSDRLLVPREDIFFVDLKKIRSLMCESMSQ